MEVFSASETQFRGGRPLWTKEGIERQNGALCGGGRGPLSQDVKPARNLKRGEGVQQSVAVSREQRAPTAHTG